MGQTLLKDMPIHMERIENNYLLSEAIKDGLNEIEVDVTIDFKACEESCISSIADILKQHEEFSIESNTISIDDHESLAQLCWAAIKGLLAENHEHEITNDSEVAILIRDEMTDFVNQNYEWKGLKA